MKPVFKCDYCDHMGTEDEVQKHETKCIYNYDRKSCWTCKHRDPKGVMSFKCLLGKEIPKEKFYEFCGEYEWNGRDYPHTNNIFSDIFGGF